MSTNFYFKIKTEIDINTTIEGDIKEKILEKLKAKLEEVVEIHIGKRSVGWYPLFEQTEYYSNMRELKEFYYDNKEHLEIIDEYNKKYSIEELQKELFDWNKDEHRAKSYLDFDSDTYLDGEGYEFTKRSFF